jgi:hypothetical protein
MGQMLADKKKDLSSSCSAEILDVSSWSKAKDLKVEDTSHSSA